jgi:filamentous hemagglutinin
MGWPDVGLANESAVGEHFAQYANPNDAIATLESRVQRSIDLRGVHAEEELAGGGHVQGGAVGSESAERAAIHATTRREVPAGQRLPRPTDVPDASYGGSWGGERGNSEWFSDVEAVNRVTNYEPIEFVGGEPVFLPWARERAIIPDMTGIDHIDFAVADRSLLRQYPGRWPNQTAVAEWRSANGLTWHHEPNLETMTLVPTELHGNVPHVGGASAARAGARPEREPVFGTSPL